tara:strand:+ start:756 stop:2972 length:2217 start_codon:yes stop_codon:yes gene_type:complete
MSVRAFLNGTRTIVKRGSSSALDMKLNPSDSSSHPDAINFNSLDELGTAISNASEGDTIDLSTIGTYSSGYFGYTSSDASQNDILDVVSNNGKSLTLENGTISATAPLSWSSSSLGSGIFESSLPNAKGPYQQANASSMLISHLVDFDKFDSIGSDDPLIAVWPKPPSDTDTNNSRYHYNSNWWEFASGEVIFDSSTYKIQGYIFSGAQKVSLEQYLNESNASEFFLAHDGGFNYIQYAQVTGYVESTGVLSVDQSQTLTVLSSGKGRCCLMNHKSLVHDAREYATSEDDWKIYYKPASGTIGNNVRWPLPCKYANSYDSGPLWITNKSSGACNLTFDSVDIVGSPTVIGGTQIYLVNSSTTSGDLDGNKIFQDCKMRYTSAFGNLGGGYQGQCQIKRCDFKRAAHQGLRIGAGFVMEDCSAMFLECRSFVQVTASSTAVNDTETTANNAPFLSIFRRNYCNLPCEGHGQALALYFGTWQNATVTDNIFVNDPSCVTMQNSGVLSRGAGTMTIANNLFIAYKLAPVTGTGQQLSQAELGWNAGSGPINWIQGTQECIFAHNTLVRDPNGDGWDAVSDPEAHTKVSWYPTYASPTTMNTYKVNNLAGIITSTTDSLNPHYHANNLSIEYDSGVSSYGSLDLADLTNQGEGNFTTANGNSTVGVIDFSDSSTPVALNAASNGSTSSGRIGILFNSLPTHSQIKSGLGVNWATTYVPVTINYSDLKSAATNDAWSPNDGRS